MKTGCFIPSEDTNVPWACLGVGQAPPTRWAVPQRYRRWDIVERAAFWEFFSTKQDLRIVHICTIFVCSHPLLLCCIKDCLPTKRSSSLSNVAWKQEVFQVNKQTFMVLGMPRDKSSTINVMSNATQIQKIVHYRTCHIPGILYINLCPPYGCVCC